MWCYRGELGKFGFWFCGVGSGLRVFGLVCVVDDVEVLFGSVDDFCDCVIFWLLCDFEVDLWYVGCGLECCVDMCCVE